MLLTIGSLAISAFRELIHEDLFTWRSPVFPLLGTAGFMAISGYFWEKHRQKAAHYVNLQVTNGYSRRNKRRKTLLLKPITLAEISPEQRKRNIVLLGLKGSGKTSFLQRLLRTSTGTSDDPEPTLGVKMTSVDLKGLRQTYYEVGGAETTRMFAKEFVHLAHLVIFVVDAAGDAETMQEARQYFRFIVKETQYTSPVFVVANKQDLPNAMPIEEVYQALGICDSDDVYVLPARCAPKNDLERRELSLLDDDQKMAALGVEHYGIIENLLYRTFTEIE